MLRVLMDDARGAFKYYSLSNTRSDYVFTKFYVHRTENGDEPVLCYDFVQKEWSEHERDSFIRFLALESSQGHLEEICELHALFFLDQDEAFNGEGDDAAVTSFLSMWSEKKNHYLQMWFDTPCIWPAKYVKTTFYLNGKKYTITPDSIGLEEFGWEAGFMESIQGDIEADLKKIGAVDIQHRGELD